MVIKFGFFENNLEIDFLYLETKIKTGMSVRTFSSTLIGIEAIKVEVETQIISGLKRFSIVGLPDGVVKEAKDRVKCALENSGFEFPSSEVIVSLAPASLPKMGSGFDLAIAVGILSASGAIAPNFLGKNIFLGELALDGHIKQTGSELASAFLLKKTEEISYLYVSTSALSSLQYFPEFNVRFVESLADLVALLVENKKSNVAIPKVLQPKFKKGRDFSDVIGHQFAKRALQVAAAGGHNVLMIGPPGSGKTMLAERLPSIMPILSKKEFLEVNKIYSALQGQKGLVSEFVPCFQRQFRSPHHSISVAGLVGGGSNIVPGEITLAHNGVLFLDEFPELRRDSLEALREPMEKRRITISRAKSKFTYPASFILVAAMNPCPCGMRGMENKEDRTRLKYRSVCKCTEQEVRKYIKKVSGPLLDRMDIQLWIPQVSIKELQTMETNLDVTSDLKAGIDIARKSQELRFNNLETLNSQMGTQEIVKYCKLTDSTKLLMEEAGRKFSFSARAYNRVLRLSRTIADLMESESIRDEHVIEALGYRIQLS